MKKTGVRNQESGIRSFILILLLFTFSISLFTSSVWAQPPSPGGGGMAQKQERLQTLITMRLANELGLSQEQALKISGIMKKYHRTRRELHQRMQGLNRQLRTVVSTDDPKKAGQVVTEIQKTKEEIDGIDGAMFKEIKPLLNPRQQAKFLLVMDDIRREIRQFRRGGGPGMGGPPSNGAFPPPK